jgi:hypothetical protein
MVEVAKGADSQLRPPVQRPNPQGAVFDRFVPSQQISAGFSGTAIRLAIFAMVARLQPVASCIEPQDCLAKLNHPNYHLIHLKRRSPYGHTSRSAVASVLGQGH